MAKTLFYTKLQQSDMAELIYVIFFSLKGVLINKFVVTCELDLFWTGSGAERPLALPMALTWTPHSFNHQLKMNFSLTPVSLIKI